MENCTRYRSSRISGLAMAASLALPAVGVVPRPALAQDEAPFNASCLIEASAQAKLGASVSGLVKNVYVDRGSHVKTGQIVAELDADVERAALAVARARAENDHEIRSTTSRLEFLSRKTKRLTRLAKAAAAPEESRDETDTDLKLSVQAVREAELNLHMAQLEAARSETLVEQRIIRSPFDGIVVERSLSPGEYLHDQAHVLSILRVDPLYVEVYLPLEHFGHVQLGDLAEVAPKEVAGQFVASVLLVDPFIDAASATFGVRLKLDNPDGKIPAGLQCTVKFHARPAGEGSQGNGAAYVNVMRETME